MTIATISQLKVNPSSIIAQANDYPVALSNRSNVAGYIVGKKLFESMVRMLEDRIDTEIVKNTDTSKGETLAVVMKNIGI